MYSDFLEPAKVPIQQVVADMFAKIFGKHKAPVLSNLKHTLLEVQEAIDAYEAGDMPELKMELADIALQTYDIAQSLNINLENAMYEKMKILEGRKWHKPDKDGIVRHIKEIPSFINELKQNEIFVFGSNTEGRHGAGAAKKAMEFGAIYGQAKGLQGQTYGIITQDLRHPGKKTLGTKYIKMQIDEFIEFANNNPDKIFLVTPIGTGLAGYSFQEIGELFVASEIPCNCRISSLILPFIK